MEKRLGHSFPQNAPDHWQVFPVRQIEDLRNLVLGGDLDAVQMSSRKVGGSLAFTACDGVVFSSGKIDGSAITRGVLSKDAATLVIVLNQGLGFRVCLQRLFDGAVGIVQPGDEFDALYAPGAFYVTAMLELERLEQMVGRELRHSGIHPMPLDGQLLDDLRSALLQIHSLEKPTAGINVGNAVLHAAISHYKTDNATQETRSPKPYETIVRLGQSYIERHLTQPISISDIAAACGSSRRTLYRAFFDVLGEAPMHYVRRLRLHQIRRDLTDVDHLATISESAKSWGIQEHGRMSGWYRDVFGEKPSATVAARRLRQLSETWL